MSTNQQRLLRALRGATTVPSDDADAIVTATAELLSEMLARNGAAPEDLVSIVFTSTPDLTAEFPAAGARQLGIGHVPLLCSVEIAVAGSVARCIRVLMHLYSGREPAQLRHVYLREARVLRPDLPAEPGDVRDE